MDAYLLRFWSLLLSLMWLFAEAGGRFCRIAQHGRYQQSTPCFLHLHLCSFSLTVGESRPTSVTHAIRMSSASKPVGLMCQSMAVKLGIEKNPSPIRQICSPASPIGVASSRRTSELGAGIPFGGHAAHSPAAGFIRSY